MKDIKTRMFSNDNIKASHKSDLMPVQSNLQQENLFIQYLLTPWCRILFEKLIVTQCIKKYRYLFMEPKGSSSCSQKPTTGPYPEPAESSSPHRSHLPKV
jgi:hypothetical protein